MNDLVLRIIIPLLLSVLGTIGIIIAICMHKKSIELLNNEYRYKLNSLDPDKVSRTEFNKIRDKYENERKNTVVLYTVLIIISLLLILIAFILAGVFTKYL